MRATELAALLERIDAGVARMDARGDDLDRRLRDVETRSDTTAQVARIERVVDQLLATLTDRFRDIEDRFDAQFKEIEKRFDDRFREIEKRFEDRFKEHDKRFKGQDDRLRLIDRWRWTAGAGALGAGTALGFAIRNSFLIPWQ